jgi:hypothetical protein
MRQEIGKNQIVPFSLGVKALAAYANLLDTHGWWEHRELSVKGISTVHHTNGNPCSLAFYSCEQ